MKVLRISHSRRIRVLWIGCDCGAEFKHTASRPDVACFRCGRSVELAVLQNGAAPEAEPGGVETVAEAVAAESPSQEQPPATRPDLTEVAFERTRHQRRARVRDHSRARTARRRAR